ncbi:APSES transcription factor Xbp1 [Stagonosporopsis vannaccii]|nr:APSES transcription factor Xbp1 [Stagonosporopsis vannaccii]
MNIQSLLNTPERPNRLSCNEVSPCPLPSSQRDLASRTAPKRQTLAKDAPIFVEGTKIVGHVNYPPHEARGNNDLEIKHREFSVFPLGEIHKRGMRHIPYASDKKDFLVKTNRESFEVFQYTYKRPGEERSYTVVWDYNTGLVRMTPFFKSCKYPKTVPSKALNQNPGLKDISYSITGGALVCQGYWVPWQAARELAATFCWELRWALTPVFGDEFLEMCKPPHDHAFAKFVINPRTVRFCKKETDRFRDEGFSYQLLLPKMASSIATSRVPIFTPPVWKDNDAASPLESGYGTDIEYYNTYPSDLISPHRQYNTRHLASTLEVKSPIISSTAQTSTSCSPVAAFAPTPISTSTSAHDTPYSESLRTKRTHSTIMNDGSDGAVVSVDVLNDERQGTIDGSQFRAHPLGTIEAAEILLSINVVARNAEALPEPKRIRRGHTS